MKREIRYLLWWIRWRIQGYRFHLAVNRRIARARMIDIDIEKQLKEIRKHYGA